MFNSKFISNITYIYSIFYYKSDLMAFTSIVSVFFKYTKLGFASFIAFIGYAIAF